MLSDSISTFKKQLQNRHPLMALDIGDKKIGIALSDPDQILALPHSVYIRKNNKETYNHLRQFITTHKIEGIIIGYPLSPDGSQNANCEKIDHFISILVKKTILPIHLQDERYSTQMAQRSLKAQEMKRKKRDQMDDAIAASILLDTTLAQLQSIT